MPLGEALDAVGRLLDDGVRLFSISFHSPSVEPGHTPYVRSAADLGEFHAWWDGMFDFFAREGIAPASIEEKSRREAAASRPGLPQAGRAAWPKHGRLPSPPLLSGEGWKGL